MIKTDEERVKALFKELVEFYKKNTYLFPKEDGSIWKLNDLIESNQEILSGERSIAGSFRIFNACSLWKLKYTQYELVEKKNKAQALIAFGQSTAYGYLSVKNASLTYGCLINNEYTLMDNVTIKMAQALIAGWNDEAFDIAEAMIASIDHGKVKNYEKQKSIQLIIGNGLSVVPASWFMLELYCKLKKRDFNRKNADFPSSMVPYDTVLKNWDTEDMIEVERCIHLLSTMHLDQAKEQVTDDDYFEFGDTSRYLFPYEILTWLKLRELKGLKNPTEFSHPLMNTPIAKMLLDIKEPLPKPKELPYAKELLETLKEKCLDVVEIPKWLDIIRKKYTKKSL